MLRLGKKGKEWAKVRKELKKRFLVAGITRCESCGSDFALSFAHSLKRRNIANLRQLREVALLCCKCHEAIELSGEAQMHRAILAIIESRQYAIQD
jgi:hypothetical protein